MIRRAHVDDSLRPCQVDLFSFPALDSTLIRTAHANKFFSSWDSIIFDDRLFIIPILEKSRHEKFRKKIYSVWSTKIYKGSEMWHLTSFSFIPFFGNQQLSMVSTTLYSTRNYLDSLCEYEFLFLFKGWYRHLTLVVMTMTKKP